jgi:hypothetical protein
VTTLREVETLWEKVCFDPDYRPEGRLQTYRELVLAGMLDVLKTICPVANGILSSEEWRTVFWKFLREAPPKNVVIRQLPYEASQNLKNHPHPFQESYPWLGELMEYEYLEVRVGFAPEDTEPVPPGQIKLNPAHALGRYTWPVHFISEQYHDPKKLPRGDYFLFLWREPQELKVQFMEINPTVVALLEHLQVGPEIPQDLLAQVAEQMNLEPTAAYLEEGQRLLENFIAKGILSRG